MATTPFNHIPLNSSTNSISLVTFPNTEKLTSKTYLGWRKQIEAILRGLGLHKFIDGTYLAPFQTIATDNTTTINPAYDLWYRQDQLLLGALVGTLSSDCISIINTAQTSLEAWNLLAKAFANPSQAHLKQLQEKIRHCMKLPSQSINEYMHYVKATADELGLLGKPVDIEDLTDGILRGLNYEDYNDVILSVKAVIPY